MITRKLAAIALCLGIATSFAPSISFAAEDHIAEAIEHAEAATNNGRQGRTEVFVEQVQIAVQHAEAADAENANPLAKAAIRDLKAGIELAKAGKLDNAIASTDIALGHLAHAK
ncbi:hypothetical protein CU048_15270 [Beijerinckiaceae bacterium]|nr:hypothetical protein CU048_15270 [Beijerinckiaceae bacterium]